MTATFSKGTLLYGNVQRCMWHFMISYHSIRKILCINFSEYTKQLYMIIHFWIYWNNSHRPMTHLELILFTGQLLMSKAVNRAICLFFVKGNNWVCRTIFFKLTSHYSLRAFILLLHYKILYFLDLQTISMNNTLMFPDDGIIVKAAWKIR